MDFNGEDGQKVSCEHERRFLVDFGKLPFDFHDYSKARITQGYLGDPNRIRVRDEFQGSKHIYTQTKKSGSGVSRSEDERRITKSEFDLFWERVDCYLEKDRYFIPWDGFEVQLNIFRLALEGYSQIEVEFKTSQSALLFIPPTWFGKEVTNDKCHDNYSLAKNGAVI